MASDDEVAVFTLTNLGTHFVIAVSPNTTVGDFHRELERTHHACFPELGKIEVHALMVRRKSCFYHLPSSMPIKYAFQHQVGTWFLHIEARTLKDSGSPCLSNFAAIKVGDHKCDGNRLTGSLVRDTREGTTICRDAAEWNSGSMTKNQTNISPRAITADGVIDGCLLNCSGVSQHPSSTGSGRAMQGLPEEQLRTKADNGYCSSALSPFTVRTPPKQSLFLTPVDRTTRIRRDRFGSSGVGKRIILASNNIRISDKKRPITPLSNIRDGKLLCCKNLCRAKFLVFEMSDSDEEDVDAL
ncbi:hypothetical protein Gotur_022373 [Gossypium turneri]